MKSHLTREMAVGLCPSLPCHHALPLSVTHYTSPDGRVCQFKAIPSPFEVLFTQYLCILHHRRQKETSPSPWLESPPPPKQRRIAHFQAGQEDASSSSSGHPPPQLHPPPFEFNPSLPLLDPPSAPAVGDAVTGAPGPFTGQSNGVDSEDALEGAANSINHKTDGFQNREDVAIGGDADPREGIVSDWDILDEEFIAGAEKLGKSEHSLLHSP